MAVNMIGAESGVAAASTNSNCPASSAGDPICSLPIVNDNTNDEIWSSWGGQWRDVFILDEDNQVVEIYWLTEHNLADPANYAELKQKLIDAATP